MITSHFFIHFLSEFDFLKDPEQHFLCNYLLLMVVIDFDISCIVRGTVFTIVKLHSVTRFWKFWNLIVLQIFFSCGIFFVWSHCCYGCCGRRQQQQQICRFFKKVRHLHNCLFVSGNLSKKAEEQYFLLMREKLSWMIAKYSIQLFSKQLSIICYLNTVLNKGTQQINYVYLVVK